MPHISKLVILNRIPMMSITIGIFDLPYASSNSMLTWNKVFLKLATTTVLLF